MRVPLPHPPFHLWVHLLAGGTLVFVKLPSSFSQGQLPPVKSRVGVESQPFSCCWAFPWVLSSFTNQMKSIGPGEDGFLQDQMLSSLEESGWF